MLTKQYDSLNEAFCESLHLLEQQGNDVESRGSKQKEILFYSCIIKDPSALSIEVPARKFKPEYAITEWLWYLSFNSKVNNIGKLANIWLKIQDDNGECESNYGTYIFNPQHGMMFNTNQWQWVLKELLNDRDSRRATIAINQPYHKGKNKNDYPCTQYLHFFIRDNQLHLGVNMRSNDAIFGFCNDVFTFCMFQQLMLNDLNAMLPVASKELKLGHYHHHAGSFHIYEPHWKMMKKIDKNYRENCQKSGYPTLNKYRLKDRILSSNIRKYALSEYDMTKEEIQTYTQQIKKEIYV